LFKKVFTLFRVTIAGKGKLLHRMALKFASILLLFFNLSETKHSITFQLANHSIKPVAAKVRLYTEGVYSEPFQTKGSFKLALTKGNYRLEVVTCDTTYYDFIADKQKTVWVIVKDKCEM
jgi:hypothetical protein